MSRINGAGNGSYLPPVSLNNAGSKPTAPASTSTRGGDSVELSAGVQGYLAVLSKGGDVRTDKVASVRAAIEAGTYETDDKLNIAVDRLLDDVVA